MGEKKSFCSKFNLLAILILVLFSFSFVYSAAPVISDADLLDQTEAKAANYFYEQVLSNGFVKDTTDTPYASTAATGFGLATLTIMAERYGTTANWIYTPTQLRARANKILDNIILIQNGQAENPLFYGTHGVLYHFIKPDNSNAGSEVSTVDTALLFAGAITAGDYFGGEVKDKANTIIGAADWSYFQKTPENNFNTKQGNTNLYQFTMSWFPTTGQNIQTWDMPTDESILVSVIALATNPNNLNYQKSLFSWPRVIRSYAGYDVVNSYDGTLFTYEFAHFFIDFNKIGADAPAGISPGVPAVDWWQNSINAAKANRQFCINNSSSYSSYGPDSWGLSSVYRPAGDYYGRLGALPNYNMVASHDGTVAPYSSISTMPFFKSEDGGLLANNLGFRVLRNLYDKRYYNLWSLYGPKDSFNEKNAISPLYLGLDQGPIAISIENYKTGLIMNQFMKNDSVKAALKKVFTCPNGVCNTQVTCSLNSQCSDNNSLTADICVNQGTAQSFCQYSLNVACSQNTQCNDFNMLTDDVCVNPGNHLSYCSFVPNGKTCVIPTTRMQITQSTDFCPGYYSAYDINIAADNIVVNCNGAMLTDPAGGLTRFIISGRNNVTIKNCIAGKVNYGVYITYSKSVTLMNNSFVGAYDSGVDVISSTKLNIINNILSDNEYQNGIYLYDVNDSNIENNTIKNNGYRGGWVHKGGLYLAFSYRNRFINNDISNNNRGLYSVYYSGNNYFANNKFCNNVEENTCGSGAIGNTGAGNTLPNKKSRFCSWLETNAIDCNQTCTETDGGYQKDIFSNLFYSDGFDTQIFSDYCSDENNLVEYSCNNIFPQKSPGIYCGAGCMNGACRKSCSTNADCDDNNSSTADTCFNPGDGPRYCQNLSNLITCRTDAECGINGWLNGTNDCNSNDVFQQYATYSCVNPGTSSSSCLSSNLFRLKQDCGDSNVSSWSANYCDGNSVKKQRVVHNNGCSVGACTSTDTNEIQVVQACLANQVCDVNQCLTPTCNTNAQCGTNGWVNSNYCSSTNIWGTYRTFACNNPGAVQANCSFNDVNQLKTTCFAGQFCSVGVCVNPVCTSDSQCNDNNVSTTDSCVNPGSAQSQCVFEPIIPCTNPTSNMQVTQSMIFCNSSYGFTNMQIVADNVIVDCNGAQIFPGYNGVLFTIADRNNVTIKNCKVIREPNVVVMVQRSKNITLTDNNFSSSWNSSIYVNDVNFITIINNDVSGSGYGAGIYLSGVNASNIKQNQVHGNLSDGWYYAGGIYLESSQGNKIVDNNIFNNSRAVVMHTSSNNVFTDNLMCKNGFISNCVNSNSNSASGNQIGSDDAKYCAFLANQSTHCAGQSCADSDTGLKYLTKGTATVWDGTNHSTFSDVCIDENRLTEYYCENDFVHSYNSTQYPFGYICDYGCFNGACYESKPNDIVTINFQPIGTIVLNRGWNLVGFPIVGTIDVSEIQSDCNIMSYVWEWDAAKTQYKLASVLQAGKSYMVYALKDCNFNLGAKKTLATQVSLRLFNGWNFISGIDGNALSKLSKMSGYAWAWNSGSSVYVTTNNAIASTGLVIYWNANPLRGSTTRGTNLPLTESTDTVEESAVDTNSENSQAIVDSNQNIKVDSNQAVQVDSNTSNHSTSSSSISVVNSSDTNVALNNSDTNQNTVGVLDSNSSSGVSVVDSNRTVVLTNLSDSGLTNSNTESILTNGVGDTQNTISTAQTSSVREVLLVCPSDSIGSGFSFVWDSSVSVSDLRSVQLLIGAASDFVRTSYFAISAKSSKLVLMENYFSKLQSLQASTVSKTLFARIKTINYNDTINYSNKCEFTVQTR